MTGTKPARRGLLIGLLAALLSVLAISDAAEPGDEGFTMTIMDVFSITGRGVVMTGRVGSGVVEVGDTVCVPLESGDTAAHEVMGLEMFRKQLESASAGQNVGVLIEGIDRKSVLKGGTLHAGCHREEQAETTAEQVSGQNAVD